MVNLKRMSSVFFLAFTTIANAGHRPQEFLQSIKGRQDEGQQIVQHFCASCHANQPLIPLGAPRLKNKKDWSPRIKKGLKELLRHTEEGFNAMPARGGCFECSDEQLKLAIAAMMPSSLAELLLLKKDHK